ncbi:MAG: ABC-2 type transport system permease protein [Flavobacteriales bacterium]|jgi:hypothetical protein
MRLLRIELLKLAPAKYFWILMMMFLVIMMAIPVTTVFLSDWIVDSFLSELGVEQINVLFDFSDIWQNFTFVFQYFTVLLSSLVVINVAQEFSLSTARQQVIDGLSRREFFQGKLLFIGTMALGVTLVAAVLCLVFGYMYSSVTEMDTVLSHIQFIPAYFLHLVHDFLFAMFIALLIRRTGIGVVVLIFYGWIESIPEAVFRYGLKWEWLANLLPNGATKILIGNPFPKFILQQTDVSVQPTDLFISLGYIGFWLFLNRWLIMKKDF